MYTVWLYDLYNAMLKTYLAENIAVLSGSSGDNHALGLMLLQQGGYAGLGEAYPCLGGDEVFSAAVGSIQKRMEECGVSVTLEIGRGMYHCCSMMPFVSVARQACRNMIEYL